MVLEMQPVVCLVREKNTIACVAMNLMLPAEFTYVRGWIAKGGNLSACGGEVELGDGKLGPFGRDPVNGSGLSDVASTVSAHPGIKPVGYVNGAVRTDRDVTRTEQCDVTDLAACIPEVGPGEIFLRVAGNENIALG